MYIHYAEIQLPSGQFVQLKFCSHDYGTFSPRKGANEFTITKKDFAEVVAPVVAYIKQIPSTLRAWDQVNYIWTIPIANWLGIKPFAEKGMFCTCIKYNDLFDEFINKDFGTINGYTRNQVPKAEDFFYEHTQSQLNNNNSNSLTLAQIEAKLKLYFDSSDLSGDLKKLYRRAAMKYHPDVNNGDSTKMSELNWLWQQYQELGGLK
jgi:hypothetical protein